MIARGLEARVGTRIDYMGQRVTKQGKRPGTRPGAGARTEAQPHAAELDARLAAVSAERDAALADLAKAKAEIAALTATRAQVVDRLDWVVDSLKSLAESER